MFIWYSQWSNTVKLTRNADKSKFTYNGRGIAFDRKGMWSFGNGLFRNVADFGVDNTSSYHTDNHKKFSVLGQGPTEGIHVSVDAVEKNSINFSKPNVKWK